jgi:hypothetical protein
MSCPFTLPMLSRGIRLQIADRSIKIKEARQMNWQSRLEKTAIALNLIGLGFGFCILGILILAKGAPADGSWVNGILGMIVGALFLFSHFTSANTARLAIAGTLANLPYRAGQAAHVVSSSKPTTGLPVFTK